MGDGLVPAVRLARVVRLQEAVGRRSTTAAIQIPEAQGQGGSTQESDNKARAIFLMQRGSGLCFQHGPVAAAGLATGRLGRLWLRPILSICYQKYEIHSLYTYIWFIYLKVRKKVRYS
jgi:hypothetical protein